MSELLQFPNRPATSLGFKACFVLFSACCLSGCLTRTGAVELPYVKPANTPADIDPSSIRIMARVEDVEAELRQLRGMIERLQAAGGAEASVRNLQERVAFLERHLGISPPQAAATEAPTVQSSRQPEGSPTGRPPLLPLPPHQEGVMPAPTAPPQAAPVDPKQPPRAEVRNPPVPDDERSYREAYLLLRRGEFKKSIPLFEAFLNNHPKSPLTPDAVYWIGEALYGLGRYNEAVLQFDRVVKEYPGSKKELNAILKQGQAFEKMGDPDSARIVFKELIKRHPQSPQARLAGERLKALPAK